MKDVSTGYAGMEQGRSWRQVLMTLGSFYGTIVRVRVHDMHNISSMHNTLNIQFPDGTTTTTMTSMNRQATTCDRVWTFDEYFWPMLRPWYR
jgi:hypothetical protein